MRRLLAMIVLFSVLGCNSDPASPKPLTPDEEKKLEAELQNARSGEGGTPGAAVTKNKK